MAEKNAVKVDTKNDLEKALDGALADLKKATVKSDDLTKSEKKEEDENLVDNPESKKEGTGKEGKDTPWKGDAGKGDGDEKKSGKGSAETSDEKGGEEDEDKKAMKDGYRKGVENDLTKSEPVKNAVEVSKFLSEIVKSMAEIIGDLKLGQSGLIKEVAALRKSNAEMADALVKSFSTQNDITKSLASEIAGFGGRPVARKSLPDGAKVDVLKKSMRGDDAAGGEKGGDLTKSQIADRIAELEMKNEVPLGSVSRYEAAGMISKSVEEKVFGKSE